MLQAKDIPNIISVARILLVFPVIWWLLNENFVGALILFFVAGISDALDGALARAFHWQSRLGGMLDPLADKFLLVSVYLCLGWLNALPWWLIGLVALRDLIIVGGALAYNFKVAQLEADPSLVSKVNTALQISLALLVVYNLAYQAPLSDLEPVLIWGVALFTLISGVDYVISWGRKARSQPDN